MEDRRSGQRRWAPALAVLLGVVAVAEVLGGVAAATALAMTWREALDAFLVTNGLMGITFATCGALIANQRPRNAVGWLLVADGIGHATAALAIPLSVWLHDNGASVAAQRFTVTVADYSWPFSIALFLPLTLLLFPDGRAVSPRWRWLTWLVVATAPMFVLEVGGGSEPISSGMPLGYLRLPHYDDLDALWTAAEVRVLLGLAVAVVALVVRYRRGGEQLRRQLLWLLLATIVVLAVVVPWSFVAGTPVTVLLAIPLIPVAIAIAVLRYQLLDIRLVVSRTVSWGLLSLLALLAYVVLVGLLGAFVSATVGRSAVATILVALGVAPLLPRLQRLVDRWMYGERGNPAVVATEVGEQLATGSSLGLPGVAVALRSALRLPYVAIRLDGELVAEDGQAGDRVGEISLDHGGRTVGSLVVGLRRGEQRLTERDRDALRLVAAPVAAALHATVLSQQLQASRERLVAAREEERRRLRRDLHDGLGPTLTGLALTADAAANLLEVGNDRSRELLGSLRHDTRDALADVRRLVDDLRPPALDELGLLAAIRTRAEQLAWREDGSTLAVRFDVPDALPALPAAVEVAAYRIATEALTNVARHARATSAVVALRCQSSFDLEITDNGASLVGWNPGVGLSTMRERAAELGGCFEAGPRARGGRVFISIPLAMS